MKTAKCSAFNGMACFVMFLIGVINAGNQVLVNHMQKSFGATDSEIGFLISAVYFGSMAMVLVFGELSERIGKRPGISLAAALVALGTGVLLFSRSIPVAAAAMLCLGFGTGGLESITLSLLEDNNGAAAGRVIVLTEALFSLGGVVTPILISNLVPADVFRPAYAVFCVLFATTALCFFLFRGIDGFAVRAQGGSSLVIFKVMKNRVTLLCALGMVLYVGAEGAFCYWAVSYFEQSGAAWAGAYAISAYWLSSIVGRLICARLRSTTPLLSYCFIAAAAAMVLLVALPGAWGKLIATALMGLALSPAYSGICFMGGHACPQYTAAAYSLMVFGGAFGGVVTQPLIGSAAMVMPLRAVFLVIGGVYVALLLLWRSVLALSTKKNE